ncbi:MAG: carbamoyltransferase HypF [bacterium]|nr:carbamoyltransferase HypF [bacterium]
MSESRQQHLEIRVSGTVQGVGFRPFIYRLAREHDLLGTVLNNSRGVVIRAQGSEPALREFLSAIPSGAPPAARVDQVTARELPLDSYTEFRILPSETEGETFTQVSPDLALCDDCRRELVSDDDRRRGYPFINCTNCGPRFTIIRALPYDRPQTTMREFPLCDACRAEYDNPADRRFHAQPVACDDCGPHARFLIARGHTWETESANFRPISSAARALRLGRIVLIQGIGGFHLACDARDENTVRELRRRKQRDEKPFALMVPDEASLRACCEVSSVEWKLLTSRRAPIVLLRRKENAPVAESVAPGNPGLGAMLPYAPLHVLLLREFGGQLVMTSANLRDDPIAYETDDALARMAGIADAALVHDRPIHMFADDSVCKVIGGAARVWRRARGYVPEAVHVPVPFRVPTLAFGPQLKNTFCLGKQSFAILSQHGGDTESALAAEFSERALNHFLRLYDADIRLAACDLHPDYSTTRLAETWCAARGVPLVRVQHHHAHLAACLAENETNERAIGLALDGTGYGSDGTIWGGEALAGDFSSFARLAHLDTVPMPGGDAAAREPWRMALAWLADTFGKEPERRAKRFMDALRSEIRDDSLRALLEATQREGLFPRTSSLGRLFDAVAALVFFGARRQYEGQAAMLLEYLISPAPAVPYPMDVVERNGRWILSPKPLFQELTRDLERGVAAEIIARRFHEGIVAGFCRVCDLARERTGLNTVALSGGCFQNEFLHTNCEKRLTDSGFRVLTHRQVPPNDGGVALGQAVIANAHTMD